MSVAQDLIAFLRTQQTVTDIVNEQITQNDADQHWDAPYITLFRLSALEDLSLGGSGGQSETEYLVQCVGRTRIEADDLSDRLHALLNGYRGTWGERRIQGVFVLDRTDDSQRVPAGSEETRNLVEKTIRVFSVEE